MTNTNKKLLYEVSIIRPLIIVLLVLYHSFAPFCEAWKPFVCFEPNECYRWLGMSAYSFMLETFVFVSGYVYAYQCEVGRFCSLGELVKKKFCRLIVPSLLFGILYQLVIEQNGGGNFDIDIYRLINGTAHMWFLPMLFCCFVFCWLICKVSSDKIMHSLLLSLLFVGGIVELPLRISSATYYLVFFMIGYHLFDCKKMFATITASRLIVIWLLFVMSFCFFKQASVVIIDWYGMFGESNPMEKLAVLVSLRFIKACYALMGTLALYLTSLYFSRTHQLPAKYIAIGNYCFGIYIFQQFVLQWLYYRTSLPAITGPELLPWVGFLIALLISALMTYLLRLSSWGRKII